MVNSNFCHYSPSLVAIYRDKIVCVGGKYCKECEIYDISIDHWSIIPELPEERYKSTLCFDYKNKFLYLFGGINTEKNKDYKFRNTTVVVPFVRLRVTIHEQAPNANSPSNKPTTW